jgi:hypothetical protein
VARTRQPAARRDAEVALRSPLVESERLREHLETENVDLNAELSEARGRIVGRSTVLHETLEKIPLMGPAHRAVVAAIAASFVSSLVGSTRGPLTVGVISHALDSRRRA